ncbi:MAG: hypothetical protein ISS15_00920 [Alphaproteobacteria bacterium]|nr:hypothetical protein [Alphaproteobacteria bacterium]MBL6937246.1 hypothetical protein [Alphaproteobacteria bacterium]MBL7096192.1 hypothetical protein [Alphaproteobacteria bacterium]
MGDGEDTYNDFYKWFSRLTAAERVEFVRANPEPEGWVGFYEMIADHPWL